MAENKTQATKTDVQTFLDKVEPEWKRDDAQVLITLMEEVTGQPPVLWGPTIIGFGRYTYTYKSGRSGEWFYAGFFPRKANFSLYVTCDAEQMVDLLEDFGKHKTGKGCIYFKRLSDINQDTLRKMIERAMATDISEH